MKQTLRTRMQLAGVHTLFGVWCSAALWPVAVCAYAYALCNVANPVSDPISDPQLQTLHKRSPCGGISYVVWNVPHHIRDLPSYIRDPPSHIRDPPWGTRRSLMWKGGSLMWCGTFHTT